MDDVKSMDLLILDENLISVIRSSETLKNHVASSGVMYKAVLIPATVNETWLPTLYNNDNSVSSNKDNIIRMIESLVSYDEYSECVSIWDNQLTQYVNSYIHALSNCNIKIDSVIDDVEELINTTNTVPALTSLINNIIHGMNVYLRYIQDNKLLKLIEVKTNSLNEFYPGIKYTAVPDIIPYIYIEKISVRKSLYNEIISYTNGDKHTIPKESVIAEYIKKCYNSNTLMRDLGYAKLLVYNHYNILMEYRVWFSAEDDVFILTN